MSTLRGVQYIRRYHDGFSHIIHTNKDSACTASKIFIPEEQTNPFSVNDKENPLFIAKNALS